MFSVNRCIKGVINIVMQIKTNKYNTSFILNKKLNCDFSNLPAQTAKLISKYGCPDFTRGTTLTNDTTYAAEYAQYVNVWIKGAGNNNANNKLTRALIEILDDNNNVITRICNESFLIKGDGSNSYASASAFIDKGTRYLVSYMSGRGLTNLAHNINCFPLKGV